MSLRVRMILVSAAMVLIVLPGIAVAGPAPGGGPDDDALIAAAMRTEGAVFAVYNDKKWDEFGAQYTDDALLTPPNHDPLRGRDAIVGYVRSVRDVVGAIDRSSIEHLRMKGAGGEMAQVLETFTAQSGHVHVTDLSLYERQPDGSVLITVEQFGFRERAVG